MNYPEELRERYNEVMFDERDIIEKFLKDQYDIRYGRQRDTWHFEPAIEMIAHQGSHVLLHDIKLDEGRFVVFYVESFCDKNEEWECFDFAYGELSKVIEALPDVNQILIKNAVSDIARLCRECSVNLEEHPFNTKINGKMTSVALVDYIDGRVVAYNHDGKVVSDEYACDFFVGLRDHINIEVLHRSDEYKNLMGLLDNFDNKAFNFVEHKEFPSVNITILGTDMELSVLDVCKAEDGRLVIYACTDSEEDIYLYDKDIRPEYLVDIIKVVKEHAVYDIMDTYNSHNPELVRKINDAWKSGKYNQEFSYIIYSIANRDYNECKEKFDCDMDNFLSSIIDDCNKDSIHNVLENVCDDQDLETILSFIRYEE